MLDSYYNFRNIRLLLTQGFNRDELLELCFDLPALHSVYQNWAGTPITKSELALQIIDYAHKKLVLDELLEGIRQVNPLRYEEHQPYHEADAVRGVGWSGKSRSFVGTILSDNGLGRGITLGGFYKGIALRLVATEWVPYGLTYVRSGWLFVPQWSPSHAIAFFKIHLLEDGTGYIHINDVSDPPHTIRLTTSAGVEIEDEFHYIAKPFDIWTFTWSE